MRMSDWSSDVCSSDLVLLSGRRMVGRQRAGVHGEGRRRKLVASVYGRNMSMKREFIDMTGGICRRRVHVRIGDAARREEPLDDVRRRPTLQRVAASAAASGEDRKSVVQGQSMYVRVGLGGRSIIKKKKHT